MKDLAFISALYRLELLSTSDYRAALVDLYATTSDTQVMVTVRRRFERLAVTS